MKTRNIAIGLILCFLVINITLALPIVSVCGATPTKEFDAQERRVTLMDELGTELQIKQISIKEGVCEFEEVFEITASKDYSPSRNKDFKLNFNYRKPTIEKNRVSSSEWFIFKNGKWGILNYGKILKGKTYKYKLMVHKGAELGSNEIQVVPSFLGVECEELSWWNVSWGYKTNSTLAGVPSGGCIYSLTLHKGSGTNNATDIFLNNHAQSDYDDLRFVLDETIELDYWIEDNSSLITDVGISVPSSGKVYVYYGNSGVSTTAEVTDFIFFEDDFEDGDVGDWTCWTEDTGAAGGSHSCTLDTGYSSTYSYRAYVHAGSYSGYDTTELQRSGISLEGNKCYNISIMIQADVDRIDYSESYFEINSETLWTNNDATWFGSEYNITQFAGSSITLKAGATAEANDYAGMWIDNIVIKEYCTHPWSVWSSEETETTYSAYSPTQYNNQRKLARTSEGYLHRVYTKFDGSNYRVYYAKSTDDGSIWTEMVLTDAGVNNTHPAIASDSEDNLWVVYAGDGKSIRYRKYEGITWQNELSISYYDDAKEPVITIDSNDNVYVAWYFEGWNLRYREYNGTSWGAIEDVRMYQTYNQPKHPSIAVDTNDYVHVVWQEYNYTSGTKNIKHRYKTSTWQDVYNITSGETYNQTHPCIATDLSGNAHIVWQTQDHQIKSIKYKSDGSWGAIKTVHNGGAYEQRNPSISVYSDNSVYATWFGQSASHHDNYIIRESHKTTGAWSSGLDILYPSGKDVVYPSLVSALYPKICSDCYTNIPDAGYAFVYDEDGAIKYYESGDLAWRCPTKYVLTLKAINTKTGADVTSFSADIGTGETKTTTNGIIKFRCLDTGYYSLKVTATEYYTYIDNIVIDATKEITVPLTSITEPDYFLPKAKTVTFTVQNPWGTTKFEDVYVEAVGYNITHPEGWLGDIFGFTNETEIYNTTQSGTTDSEGQIVFVMVETIKYKLTFVKEDVGINKTWFKYPTRDEYTIVIWAWEYPEEGTEEMMETTLNITTSTINDTHALIHVNYTDPSNLTSSLNVNITRLTTFNREEVVWDYTVTNQSIVNESFVVTPYQGRSFSVKVTALHEKWGEKIWEYGIKFKGLLSDLELPEKMYPIIAIALIFFIGGFFGATTALQGSLIVCIVSWIFYGIGWLNLGSDVVMVGALSLATIMSVLGLLMERGRKAGVQ